MIDYKKLKNGTDIRGIALGDNITLSKEAMKNIAIAFCSFMKKKCNKKDIKIGVGYDSRLSSEISASIILSAIKQSGIDAINSGLASTPSMFMGCIYDETNFDASIEITASHLPKEYQGMKFFTKEGGVSKEDIDEIISIAENLKDSELENINIHDLSEFKKIDIIKEYSKNLRNILIDKIGNGNEPLKDMKIIVDAGNGVGGFFASEILKPLGADITGSSFLEPDGNFPNHIPNPENKEAILSIKESTIKSNADLGIIFDTDCDRSAVIDSSGFEINRNRLIALMSAIVLEEFKETTIVTDSVTSSGLTKFIESLGGKHHRFKRGYKNVINESIRLNNENICSAMAIETSGHGALKENYFLDDGAYMAIKIIIFLAKLKKEGKKIIDVISSLKEAKEIMEKRLKINEEDFKPYANKVLEKVKEYFESKSDFTVEKVNYEGVRVNYKNGENEGWFLIRTSLHEPLLAINVESDFEGGNEIMYSELIKCISIFEKIEK